MFCSLRYQLFWNLCFSFDIWYFHLSRWSIVVLCVPISPRCLDYQICYTKHCWHSVDAHFQDAAGINLLLFLPLMAANISSMDVCNQLELRFHQMHVRGLHLAVVMIHNGSQGVHATTIMVARMQNTYYPRNNIWFVREAVLSRITLRPHVDQLAVGHACASRFNHDDAIMSSLLGTEKPSAVCIIIGHTYYLCSSWAIHSEVALTQNYVCSRR